MRLEPGQISGAQAVYLTVVAIVGTATLILPGPVIRAAGPDAWAATVASTLLTLIPGYLWVRLAARWPGRDLFELAVAAGGRLAGGLVNALLLLWVIIITTGISWIATDVIVTSFLPFTPRPLLIASIVLPAAYAAHGRLEVVARLSQVTFWVLAVLAVALMVLSARDADLRRLLPAVGAGARPVLKGAFAPMGILTENTMLAALLPFLARPCRPGRLLLAVTALAGAILAGLTAWTVAIFGPELPKRFQYPVLMAAHVISMADILERLDALMIVLWVAGAVAKLAFWYWLLCLGTARLLGLRDYRPLVWPLALPVMAGAFGHARDAAELSAGMRAWTEWTVALVGMAVPLLLLGLGAVRRTPGTGRR